VESAAKLDLVQGILKSIRLEDRDLTALNKLLKNERYEVRRAAVAMLGLLAKERPGMHVAVDRALNEALSDRDKAVVEAARNELKNLGDGQSQELNALLMRSEKMLQMGDFDSAVKLYQMAKAMKPEDPRIQDLAKVIEFRKVEMERAAYKATVQKKADAEA